MFPLLLLLVLWFKLDGLVVVVVVLTLLLRLSVDVLLSRGVEVGPGADGRMGRMVEEDGRASEVGLDRRVVPRLLQRTVLEPEEMYSNARWADGGIIKSAV